MDEREVCSYATIPFSSLCMGGCKIATVAHLCVQGIIVPTQVYKTYISTNINGSNSIGSSYFRGAPNLRLYAYRGRRLLRVHIHFNSLGELEGSRIQYGSRGIIQWSLFFFTGHLHVGWYMVWREDRRTNTLKTHVDKRLDYIFRFLLTIPHFTWTMVGRTYVFNKERSTNMHLQIPWVNQWRPNFAPTMLQLFPRDD